MKVTKKQKALVWFCLGYSKTYIQKNLRIKASKLNKWIKDDIGELNLKPKNLDQKLKSKKSRKLKKEEIESPCFDETIKKKTLYLHSQKIPEDIIFKYLKINSIQLFNWTTKIYTEVKSEDYVKKQNQLSYQAGRTNFITQICNKNKDYIKKATPLHQ
jgi:hypothetical protein